MLADILYIWSDSEAVSVAVWLVLAMTVLYLGRTHAHHLFRSTGRALRGSLRLAGRSIQQLEERVRQRNHDVLLAAGREEAEKAIEREFTRVNAIVDRDLGQYPELHRQLSEVLQKIEADYQACTEEAPMPPEWSEMVQSITSLPKSGDPHVTKVLENIKSAVERSHQETLKAYQKNVNERHKILHGMQPEWRRLNGTMDEVNKRVTALDEQAKAIDRHMDQYEAMRRRDDRAINALTSSSLTQFFIASLVLVIAAFGGLINFHLIALPMSEMVGGAAYIGTVPMSDIAAMVIIMVEISMGIFFLESLRITRMFPMIGRMDDRLRRRLGLVALTILVIFATVESSLAYLRDLLAQDREALTQTLAGAEVAEAQFRWIPSVAQMVLSFILPFALAFVAIPLEAFIHSLRTVLGLLALGLLRTVRLAVRVSGGLAHHLSQMLVSLYDLFIMLPLGVERMVTNLRTSQDRATPGKDTGASSGKAGRRRSGKAGEKTDESQLKPREV